MEASKGDAYAESVFIAALKKLLEGRPRQGKISPMKGIVSKTERRLSTRDMSKSFDQTRMTMTKRVLQNGPTSNPNRP